MTLSFGATCCLFVIKRKCSSQIQLWNYNKSFLDFQKKNLLKCIRRSCVYKCIKGKIIKHQNHKLVRREEKNLILIFRPLR